MKVSPKELAEIEAIENDEVQVDHFKENIQKLLNTKESMTVDKGDKLVYHPKAYK